MKLTFLYVPVADLAAAAAFYRDALGLEEAWRESDDTIAFALPDSDAELMVSTEQQAGGPMYLVDDARAWLAAHPGIPVRTEPYAIPGGTVAGLVDPAGNAFYVFDQPDA